MKKGSSSNCYASQFKPANQPSYRSVVVSTDNINAYQNLKKGYRNQVSINPSDDLDVILKELGDYHGLNKNIIDEKVSEYLFLDAQLFIYEQLDFDSLDLQDKNGIVIELMAIKEKMFYCLINDKKCLQQYDVQPNIEVRELTDRFQAFVNSLQSNNFGHKGP
ncbi:MAG: hypothetical protein K2Q14_07205 [Gammaproteobacteria bacterium]|nr:hypothetical protein [Gammaproteobacteria bacterium]